MLRIAEAREARGWTQEQLANAIGTTQATIQRWESGAIDPQVSKVEAISKALGITIAFLLGVDQNGRETNVMAYETPANKTTALSIEECELVNMYRRMDAENKARLIDNARAFAALSEKDTAGMLADVERAGRTLV